MPCSNSRRRSGLTGAHPIGPAATVVRAKTVGAAAWASIDAPGQRAYHPRRTARESRRRMSNLEEKVIDPRLIASVAQRAASTSPRLADAIGGGAGFSIIP